MAPQPRRGQIWTLAGTQRRILIYSGNMFNDLPDVPYVITMEVVDRPEPMDLALPDGSRVVYTWLDHIPKAVLAAQVGEVDADVMATVNNRLFMVLTTN